MPKRERSAGVIVVKPAPSPEDHHYLLLDYGKHWDFPKGHVERGEELTQTALRELEEETGVKNVQLIAGFSHEIEYFFRNRRKELVHKSVWFCLAKTEKADVRLSHEHVGYAFLPFDAALKRVTYPSAKSILREAEAFLAKQ
ncbi:MAG TPA: NUDIX domain-containing protein [Tepidisphaeraceae bacterium]|nr:NUDIX domain-containing protein [Tepidisphaeraceae bacterium]